MRRPRRSYTSNSITEGFLPRLGPRFLARLYRRIVLDERSFLLIAEESAQTVGMIAGTEDVGALYRRFAVRDGVGATLVAAPQVVRNLGSVIETWRYGGSDDHELPPAELLSIAIASSPRGQGVGRALVGALEDEFARRGTDAVKVVVGASNDAALALYRGCGFADAAATEVHRDVPSKVLVWSRPH